MNSKEKRILEVVAEIKKEVGYDNMSTWAKNTGVAHWGGMTNEFFVVLKHEAYGGTHERIYSWEIGDFTFKKVSPRHTDFLTEKKVNKLTLNYEMENFDLVDALHSIFNKAKI